MAPPCHHGWEKVQDNNGNIKAGASDGWKEFMRAPGKVREENVFPYTCLRKRESGEMVPSAGPHSPTWEGGLISDSVLSGPAVLADDIGQKGMNGYEWSRAVATKSPLHKAH